MPGPRPITPFFIEGHFMAKNMFFSISAQSKVNIDIKVYIFEFLILSAPYIFKPFTHNLIDKLGSFLVPGVLSCSITRKLV